MHIVRADKTDKKAIQGFYKQQHYSAGFIGYDRTYLIKQQQQIIASVILSRITVDNPHELLHALVVDKVFQHQGLASRLLRYVKQNHATFSCFANAKLAP